MSDTEYGACLAACLACTAACERCSTEALKGPGGAFVDLTRLTRDCSATCWFAARLLARRSEFDVDVCHLCVTVAEACARECEKYDLDHCRACAAACRRCAERCRALCQLV